MNKESTYEAPSVNIIEVVIEKGFANSISDNTNNDFDAISPDFDWAN